MGSHPTIGRKNHNRRNRADKVQNRPGSGLVDNPGTTHPSFSLFIPLFADLQTTGKDPVLARTVTDILTIFKNLQGIPIIHLNSLQQDDSSTVRAAKKTFRTLYQENTIYCQQTAGSNRQWFIRTSKIKEKIRQLLRQGTIIVYPPSWHRSFENWLSHTGDLPICCNSPGNIQVPHFFCPRCSFQQLTNEFPLTCPGCQAPRVIGPSQTLNNWFTTASLLAGHSSVSLLVADLNTFFLHLAPMAVLAVYLSKRNPVRDIVIYGRLKGEKYGYEKWSHGCDPDTIRFGLASHAIPGRSPVSSHIPMNSYQALSNKIQQACNYVQTHLQGDEDIPLAHRQMAAADRWLLHRLNTIVQQVTDCLDNYRIDKAAQRLHHFFHSQYCNWYLEFSRGNLTNRQTRKVLLFSLTQIVAMFQPFFPDLCRKIYHKLNLTDHTLPMPSFDSRFVFIQSFKQVELLKHLIKYTRSIRGIHQIPPTKPLGIYLKNESQEEKQIVESGMDTIRRLGFFQRAEIVPDFSHMPRGFKGRLNHWQILIYFLDEGERQLTLQQLQRQSDTLIKKIALREKKLNDQTFLTGSNLKTVTGLKKELQNWIKKENQLEKTLNDLS